MELENFAKLGWSRDFLSIGMYILVLLWLPPNVQFQASERVDFVLWTLLEFCALEAAEVRNEVLKPMKSGHLLQAPWTIACRS